MATALRFLLALLFCAPVSAQVYPYFPPPGMSYNATGGDATPAGSLILGSDTLQLNSPATPALNPAIDISAANGLKLCADTNSPYSGECVYYMDPGAPISGAIVYDCLNNPGHNGCFVANNNGDLFFQQVEAGADVSTHDINVSTAANSFGVYLLGYSNLDRCALIAQNPASATHPPQGGGTNLTSATLPNGGGYLGCFPAVTFSFFTGGKETFRQDINNNLKFTGGKTTTATGDTAGFHYFESVAGVPTGTPATTYTGASPCRYDSTDARWYCYNGSSWVNVADKPTAPVLSGTTGSIGGGALAAGACATGTVTITGVTTSMALVATPAATPGAGFYQSPAYVSATNTVTVSICAAIAGTPTATTYNVRAIP